MRIGEIVHYVSYGTPGGEYTSQCRAAVVAAKPGTADADSRNEAELLDLAVLNPSGVFFDRCPRSQREFRGGTWHPMEACRD